MNSLNREQQNKTERWVEEFDKEIQKIREEIEEQRLELVEMNDCDGNVCECETGYDVAETYQCKHCSWIVFDEDTLKSIVHQAILSAEANGREQILKLADGITFEDGFGGRVDVRKELLDFEKFMKALSLPDQEQLSNSKTDE